MSREGLAHGNQLLDCMIVNQVALFFEHGFRLLHVVDNQHIVDVNVGGTRDPHIHHAQFLLQSPQQLHPNFHCYKLSSKD
jgi:hypothetical protein